MTQAIDLITDALVLIGAYAAGDTITDADAQYCLRQLNDLQDSLSLDTLACYEIQEQSAPLVIGQQAYTIGTGGNFNMTRPNKIPTGPGVAYVQDSNGNNYDMMVVPRDVWNLYGNRSNLITSNFPNVLFYDPQYPLGVINILPFPNQAYTLFWDSYLGFTSFSSISSTFSLPPGYASAWKTNLACKVYPAFFDGEINPLVRAEAATSLAKVKRNNYRENVALYDKEIVSRSTSSYNIYSDTPGGSIPGVA